MEATRTIVPPVEPEVKITVTMTEREARILRESVAFDANMAVVAKACDERAWCAASRALIVETLTALRTALLSAGVEVGSEVID